MNFVLDRKDVGWQGYISTQNVFKKSQYGRNNEFNTGYKSVVFVSQKITFEFQSSLYAPTLPLMLTTNIDIFNLTNVFLVNETILIVKLWQGQKSLFTPIVEKSFHSPGMHS